MENKKISIKQGHKYKHFDKEVLSMENKSAEADEVNFFVQVAAIDRFNFYPLSKPFYANSKDLFALPMRYFGGNTC